MKFHSIFIVLSAAAMILLGMGLRTRAAPVPGDEETNMAQVMPDINVAVREAAPLVGPGTDTFFGQEVPPKPKPTPSVIYSGTITAPDIPASAIPTQIQFAPGTTKKFKRNLGKVQHQTGLLERQTGPPSAALQLVINLASKLLAIQVAGAATSNSQLNTLCQQLDYSRIAQLGYNTTLGFDIICNAASQTALAPISALSAEITQLSTEIWIVQALGVTQGNLTALCNIINISQASQVALNGTEVKAKICATAGGEQEQYLVTDATDIEYPS
ncbi:hypothetical protein MMC12_007572 [Toensbergia leucococca]|nr:hypothetical protein [Toensbergia leucococca]